MKSGQFSNKFQFRFAHLQNGVQDDIGERYLNIVYAGMCCGCPLSKDIILREFIHTEYDRPCIYEGMKLNTEFRVFYDFAQDKVMGTVNYWDYDTMARNIYDKSDRERFLAVGRKIEEEYESLKGELEDICKDVLPAAIGMKGQWSVDFMWTGTAYALIDMAVAQDSFYYDRIS